jgi:hypothetical protein
MLDHHLQRSIVYRLALSHEVRFSDLKPDTIENKLFTYHLKKVVAAGLVKKDDDGLYSLTPEGRRLGIRVLDKQQVLVDRADSVLFMVVRRKSDGAWLLYKRNVHPLIDKVGFMHATPTSRVDCPTEAKNTCLAATGLTGNFTALGGGYFRVYEGENLESFTNFTLLVCEDATGELQQNDEYADYFWETEPNFAAENMLPDSTILAELYQAGKPFFVEKTFRLPAA